MKHIKSLFASIIAATAAFSAQAYDPDTVERLFKQGPNLQISKADQNQMLEYLQTEMAELHHFVNMASQDAWQLDQDLKKAGYKDLRSVKPGTKLYQRLHEDVAPSLKSYNERATKLWQDVTWFNEVRWNSPECKGKTKCKQLVYDIYNGQEDDEEDFLEGTMFQKYSDLNVTVPYNPRLKVLNENEALELSNKM